MQRRGQERRDKKTKRSSAEVEMQELRKVDQELKQIGSLRAIDRDLTQKEVLQFTECIIIIFKKIRGVKLHAYRHI